MSIVQLICAKNCTRTWEYENKNEQGIVSVLKDLAVQGERQGNDKCESVVITSQF